MKGLPCRIWPLLLLFAPGVALGEDARWRDFDQKVRPVLATHCLRCHGAKDPKGGVDLSAIRDLDSLRRSRKVWRKTLAQVEAEEMPPAGEKPLPDGVREGLVGWLKGATAPGRNAGNERDPGPSPIRRLSLVEYNNTVRDLFGFEYDAASSVGMPDDRDSGQGFGNLAATLDIPPALLDKYFASADKILDHLFHTELNSNVDGSISERARATREAMFLVKPYSWRKPDDEIKPPDGLSQPVAARRIIATFLRRAYRRPPIDAEVDDLMRVHDRATAKGLGYVGSVRLMLKAVLVSPRFLFRIERDPQGAGAVHRVDDYELAARLSYFLWSSMPDEILVDLADRGRLSTPGPSAEPTRLPSKAIGTPPRPNDREHTREAAIDGDRLTHYEGADPDASWVGIDLGRPRVVAQVRLAARADAEQALVGGKAQASNDPEFKLGVIELFTIDKHSGRAMIRRDVTPPGPVRYLRVLTPRGQHGNLAELEAWGVEDGTVLDQQVRRMLAHSKAHALTEGFAASWLQVRRLPSARPSTEFFPEFNPEIRKALYDETAAFFDGLRVEDRSVIELLDADYTYLNEELARYYKLPAVSGKELRRVSLRPETGRGGLLGMGSVLALTSHTSRTSPTMRGKWVLEVILGTPPAPPPADAGMFKDEEKGKEPKTFREKMAMHASRPSCAGCHKKMDPLGYALEDFNAVGIRRADDRGKPLDNAGVLPTGESFKGVGELKRLLLARKDQFERNLVEQALIYAIGRELDSYDETTVDAVAASLDRDGHRFSALISGIVTSDPFLYRKSLP